MPSNERVVPFTSKQPIRGAAAHRGISWGVTLIPHEAAGPMLLLASTRIELAVITALTSRPIAALEPQRTAITMELVPSFRRTSASNVEPAHSPESTPAVATGDAGASNSGSYALGPDGGGFAVPLGGTEAVPSLEPVGGSPVTVPLPDVPDVPPPVPTAVPEQAVTETAAKRARQEIRIADALSRRVPTGKEGSARRGRAGRPEVDMRAHASKHRAATERLVLQAPVRFDGFGEPGATGPTMHAFTRSRVGAFIPIGPGRNPRQGVSASRLSYGGEARVTHA